ncbi:MAG: class IV adenylate cyclase [Terriglobales bacterium]
MPNQEIEIKFRVQNLREITHRLRKNGFRLITARTHEMNTLYDLKGQPLRKRSDLLRLRKYGSEWTLTYKAKGKAGSHKTRIELETKISDGKKMEAILLALGFLPSFRYEKFRAEWSDGKGNVVLDETPIGNFGEIEGKSRWIDRVARTLEIPVGNYIKQSYTELFYDWKKRTRSSALEMTFKAARSGKRI